MGDSNMPVTREHVTLSDLMGKGHALQLDAVSWW